VLEKLTSGMFENQLAKIVKSYHLIKEIWGYEMEKNMDIIRILLKIIMWFLIVEFGCNFIMQAISYSFYKNAKKDGRYFLHTAIYSV